MLVGKYIPDWIWYERRMLGMSEWIRSHIANKEDVEGRWEAKAAVKKERIWVIGSLNLVSKRVSFD